MRIFCEEQTERQTDEQGDIVDLKVTFLSFANEQAIEEYSYSQRLEIVYNEFVA